MTTQHPINVKKVLLKKITHSFYSSLPYSAFRTAITPYTHGTKLNVRLGQFKWRSNVTTLRAPKHFKVGRQHYNKGGRITIITLTQPANTDYVNLINPRQVASAVLRFSGNVDTDLQLPLSITKTTATVFSFKIIFGQVI